MALSVKELLQTIDNHFLEERKLEYCRAYDDRAETEKEIWDMKALGIMTNPTVGTRYLSFFDIEPPWFRRLVQAFMRYNIALHSPGDCCTKLCTRFRVGPRAFILWKSYHQKYHLIST